MMKLVNGISIPTTVRKPIERYALGTDSSPDIRSPSAKHTLSKHSNNCPPIRVAKYLKNFESKTNEKTV